MSRVAGTSSVWQVVEDWLRVVPFPPSQSRLAERVGVSRSAVSDWKSGKTRPGPENLESLASVMEAQLGPDVRQRLYAALLQDMGYIEGTQRVDISVHDVDVPDSVDFIRGDLRGDDGEWHSTVVVEGRKAATLAARYLTQAGGRPADAARLLAHDGAAGANVDEDLWLQTLAAVSKWAASERRPPLAAVPEDDTSQPARTAARASKKRPPRGPRLQPGD